MFVPLDPQKLSLEGSRIHQLTAPKTLPLKAINIQPPKRGTASRFHQPDGGPPLEFINIQPQNGGPPLELINHQPKNGGPPLGTISMDLAVSIFRLKAKNHTLFSTSDG